MPCPYFRSMFGAAIIGAQALHAPMAMANEEVDILGAQISEIRQQFHNMKQAYENQIAALAQRLKELESSASKKPVQVSEARPAAASPPPVTTLPSTTPPGNGDLQLGLSSLFASGGSSVDNAALKGLQAGAHDPNQNGFTVQNVELTIGAAVDPYFNAQANIIFQIDADGETVVELEEAFFTTRSLPWGLQVKGGQFYTEFGRQNPQHPHTWSFVDQPVVLSRFFGGDGLRSQGARVAWLMPTDWYSELYVGVQNAKGETVTSFLSELAEEVGGHTLIDRNARGFGDLLYSARWLNGIDLSDTVSANLGLSSVLGPNASGTSTNTRILGADIFLKWQARRTHRGSPFVSWHTEALHRRYEAGDASNPIREVLKDWGLFTQVLWGFKPGWVAGLRWDYATAQGQTSLDPLRDTRNRLSPNLTWYPTEFSKVRLQYNRDWATHLQDRTADSIWLQFEFSLGRHAAHIF